jgi:hypothetical protein
MSVKVAFLEFDGLDLHGLDFFEVLFVVQTVAENIAKCA